MLMAAARNFIGDVTDLKNVGDSFEIGNESTDAGHSVDVPLVIQLTQCPVRGHP
jgi:hypothetical protein